MKKIIICILLSLVASFTLFSASPKDPNREALEKLAEEYAQKDENFGKFKMGKGLLKVAMAGASKEDKAEMKSIEAIFFILCSYCSEEVRTALMSEVVTVMEGAELLGTETDEKVGQMSVYGVVQEGGTKIKDPLIVVGDEMVMCIYGVLDYDKVVDVAKSTAV